MGTTKLLCEVTTSASFNTEIIDLLAQLEKEQDNDRLKTEPRP